MSTGHTPSTPVVTEPSTQHKMDIFSDQWWTKVHPSIELHGYYRLRTTFDYNMYLDRSDPRTASLFPRPIDNTYTTGSGAVSAVPLCAPAGQPINGCGNRINFGADMRFRVNPEIDISDNLRIMSQVDMLDNVVLGSTPTQFYAQGYTGQQPFGFFTSSTDVPVAGVNNPNSSIAVKRVWGEYNTPLGLLQFGRQPVQWGLGILYNAGNGYDSDWQTTFDRIAFTGGIPSMNLKIGGAWNFLNSGPISSSPSNSQGQAFVLGNLDTVTQIDLFVKREIDHDTALRELALGHPVVNAGALLSYRWQTLANDTTTNAGAISLNTTTNEDQLSQQFTRRAGSLWIPDLWGQVLYKQFRFEAEWVAQLGTIENTVSSPGASNYLSSNNISPNGWTITSFMLATESEFRALEDKLRVMFWFGWATGDSNLPDGSIKAGEGFTQHQNAFNHTYSMAEFHPDYRIDLILFRNILTRVAGAYYFRPSVDYDFIRNPDGQKVGGGAAIIWSRASEPVQTPGHAPDLGIEINARVYYQSKDGALNNDPTHRGGFYTSLEYGILFPLAGLGYQQGQVTSASALNVTLDATIAHEVRWYLGIFF